MLVLFSDIHLTDNSTSSNVNERAFELLGDEIILAAKKEAKNIEVVMLGDIFDLVRTDYWHRNEIAFQKRPWNGQLSKDTATNNDDKEISRQYKEILDDILKQNSSIAFINMLNNIKKTTGKDAKVTYVVGNHDQAINNYSILQKTLSGLIPGISFAHSIKKPEYGVIAGHGHEWDSECYGLDLYNIVLNKDKKINRFDELSYHVMSIGEVITAELMGGLIFYVSQGLKEKNMNSAEDIEFLTELKEVNNLRPMLSVFRWLSWFTKGKDKTYKRIISESLKKSIDNVVNSELGKLWDELKKPVLRPIGGDITDWLDFAGHYLSNIDALNTIDKLASFMLDTFEVKKSLRQDCYSKGAKNEWEDINNNDFQYVIYGHTHEAKINYFSGELSGKVKMYINTGTYLPRIDIAEDKKSFVSSYQMSMVYVYSDEENTKDKKTKGPTIDIWNGIKRKEYK